MTGRPLAGDSHPGGGVEAGCHRQTETESRRETSTRRLGMELVKRRRAGPVLLPCVTLQLEVQAQGHGAFQSPPISRGTAGGPYSGKETTASSCPSRPWGCGLLRMQDSSLEAQKDRRFPRCPCTPRPCARLRLLIRQGPHSPKPGFSLTLRTTETTPTYADIISLVLSNMKKRRRNLEELSQLHCSEWTYFDSHVKELRDHCPRYRGRWGGGLKLSQGRAQPSLIASCAQNEHSWEGRSFFFF